MEIQDLVTTILKKRAEVPSDRSVLVAVSGIDGLGKGYTSSAVQAVIEVHSHHQMSAHFSPMDDADECHGFRLYGVLGKNITRQCFCEAEIGLNKAQVLAARYSLAWGLPIAAIPEPFKGYWVARTALTVLLGCVDNGAARRELASALELAITIGIHPTPGG